LPKENELEFRSLDFAISKKRYILLVQVGKEGWDCPSLTGVILSQKGDSPQNMVLQTSCRCLRQVDKGKEETAVIWLNKDNADILNKQLKQEQNSSIDELNNTKRMGSPDMIERHSRMDYLQLPIVDFYQMQVTYQSIDEETTANTKAKLIAIVDEIDDYKASALISTSQISNIDTGTIDIINESGIAYAIYNQWLFEISRQSFGLITENELHQYDTELTPIFDLIIYEKLGIRFFNELYDLHAIQSKIRVAFSIKRDLKTDTEVIPEKAQLLIASKLSPVEKNTKLYPNEEDTAKILELDKTNEEVDFDWDEIRKNYDIMFENMKLQGMEKWAPEWDVFKAQKDYSFVVKAKNNTFHYLPYNFGASGSSGFELLAMQETLRLADFSTKNLEVYYNGDNNLTQFKIDCFSKNAAKRWNKVGEYTTDFLIIKRTEKEKIHKILMIETKGEGFSNNPDFIKRKHFVETEFLKLNQGKFGYPCFDFLYLEDSKNTAANTIKLNTKINQFFND
jgi:hypothetical protein